MVRVNPRNRLSRVAYVASSVHTNSRKVNRFRHDRHVHALEARLSYYYLQPNKPKLDYLTHYTSRRKSSELLKLHDVQRLKYNQHVTELQSLD